MKTNIVLKSASPRTVVRGIRAFAVGAAIAGLSLTANAATITSKNGFVNTSIATQTGTFTATFDASPSSSPANDTLSFSKGVQSAYTGLAATVRFSTTGKIDARNGGAYAAVTSVPFSAGVSYHFRMVVNVPAKTYSAYVTAPGGTEQTIASNYVYRTEQANITSINNFNADVNPSPGGSLTYSLLTIDNGSSSSSSSSSVSSSSSSSVSSSSSSSVSSSSSSSVSSSSSSSVSSSSSSKSSSSSSSSAKTPADVLSLGNWTLQLPTGTPGNPDTISASQLVNGFQNTYFNYDSTDNSVAFFAPDNGVHTPNSAHPRSELREMQSDGTTPANWDPFDSLVHTLSASLKVTDARHRLCVGQVHIGSVLRGTHASSTKPLMELYYEPNGGLTIGVNGSPTSGQTETSIGNVPVGTQFSYQIVISGGTLKVSINGSTKFSQSVPSGFKDYGQYFKAGDYNQTTVLTDTVGTKDKFYTLTATHQ